MNKDFARQLRSLDRVQLRSMLHDAITRYRMMVSTLHYRPDAAQQAVVDDTLAAIDAIARAEDQDQEKRP